MVEPRLTARSTSASSTVSAFDVFVGRSSNVPFGQGVAQLTKQPGKRRAEAAANLVAAINRGARTAGDRQMREILLAAKNCSGSCELIALRTYWTSTFARAF